MLRANLVDEMQMRSGDEPRIRPSGHLQADLGYGPSPWLDTRVQNYKVGGRIKNVAPRILPTSQAASSPVRIVQPALGPPSGRALHPTASAKTTGSFAQPARPA